MNSLTPLNCLIKVRYISNIVPEHTKKNDPTDKLNYRPVSLLPLLSKVFEKLMHEQLYSVVFAFFQLLKKELDSSGSVMQSEQSKRGSVNINSRSKKPIILLKVEYFLSSYNYSAVFSNTKFIISYNDP